MEIPLAVYGAGGAGRELRDLARQMDVFAGREREIIFVDDLLNGPLFEESRLYSFTKARELFSPPDLRFVIGLGEPEERASLAEKVLAAGYAMENLIHPSARPPDSVRLGRGVALYPGVFLACDVCLEDNVLIMASAAVSHDAYVGAHSVCAAGAKIAGHCRVGRRCFLGMNCAVRENTRIGDGGVVGMGTVVLEDVEENMLVIGNPGRARPKPAGFRVFGRG
ncbi:MAG: hypothetical protein FWF99_06665 [Desulfovibrionaceae bacterium]|nr:hypothetical protein [Desulfovibrionaceae bacterium]